MRKIVRAFIQNRFPEHSTFLLGYSGGPDSKALLVLLLQCQKEYSFTLHLAHVNHNWRKESVQEVQALTREAEALGLSFYSKECDSQTLHGTNLEEEGRIARYQFFSELYGKLGCTALFLAHHADDQAETVIKRMFEGASLLHLGGLSEEVTMYGMHVCRPLLAVPKGVLVAYVEARGLSYLHDETNRDPRFLRGRMREVLFPTLSEQFGKECRQNLVQLGTRARELREYFFSKFAHLLPEGRVLDVSRAKLHPLELEFLLREWLGKNHCVLSRGSIQGVIASVLGSKTKRFPIKKNKGWIQVNKQTITIIYF